jgi:NADPH:quinone reductase-like Zn-dependent oxidoreductase
MLVLSPENNGEIAWDGGLRIIAKPAGGRDYVSRLAREIGVSRPLLHMHLQRLEVQAGISRPRAPAWASTLAGRVEVVGRNVTRLQPGDEVFGQPPEVLSGRAARGRRDVHGPDREAVGRPGDRGVQRRERGDGVEAGARPERCARQRRWSGQGHARAKVVLSI